MVRVWFVCSLLFLMSSNCGAAIVRLRGEAQVSGTLVRLGDMAEISECGDEVRVKLEEVTIGPAPAPGRSVRVTLDIVRRELTLRGVSQHDLQFRGATTSQISSSENRTVRPAESTTIHPSVRQKLEEAIVEHLQRESGLGPFRVSLSESATAEVPSGVKAGSIVRLQGGRAPWNGPQELTVYFRKPDGEESSFAVSCLPSQLPRLLALKHGLPRGQVIREQDLVFVGAGDSDVGFDDPAEVIGTETQRTLHAKQIIQSRDVRRMPLVRRNDVVAVTVRIGGISVMRYCKSHDEGASGQMVTLSPVDSKERITARVTGYREATVDLNTLESSARPSSSMKTTNRIAASPEAVSDQASGAGLRLVNHSKSNSRKRSRREDAKEAKRPASELTLEANVGANAPAQLP